MKARVEVAWMDGKIRVYEPLRIEEIRPMLLLLVMSTEEMLYLPYDHIRLFRVRFTCETCGGTREVVRGDYKFSCPDCTVESAAP